MLEKWLSKPLNLKSWCLRGLRPLDPYQGYALHPPEFLAAPLDHQHNFEYPALPTPNQKFRIPP
ncbi:hypothetical protein DPMN_012163 [Dreissena polymorpha]|uniref:Uncharacterized protein n=1 Tax=Dreissena polymorpha TaxID=45954 RepID=A0A9D4S121_DREPO|nr:hypothetical protein DPMN_012163 [Dreissena polymorpha]